MSLPVRPIFPFVVAVSVLGASACSQDPKAGDAGYRFNLAGHYASDMTVRDTRYTGSMDLATRRGGVLSGTMNITAPIGITAKLSGLVSGDSMTFGGPYRTPDCTGVLRGRGRIAAGGKTAWGSLSIDDGCVGAMAGNFRLER
jgi:hypothetical protein